MTECIPYCYDACGLVWRVDIPLGALPLRAAAPTSAPDVEVHVGGVPELEGVSTPTFTHRIGDTELRVHEVAGGSLWVYPDETRFWVRRDAREIRMSWPTAYVVEDAATYLLGPLLGHISRRLGHPALHGTTVERRGRGLMLLGPAGAGKSTLAAALIARGHGLVAEDVSALAAGAGSAVVHPGIPFVKLWPDSAAAHGHLPRLTPNWDKRLLAARPSAAPCPLHLLVFLSEGVEVAATPLSPREALVELLDNVYGAYALTAVDRARDLELLGRIAEQVPAIRLTRTAAFQDLPRLCAVVEEAV